MTAPRDEIAGLVREMNAAWLEGSIDELGRFFAQDAVMAPPGGAERIVGVEAVVDSFRQYAQQAVTHRFEELDLHVDVVGPTAVAIVRFAVRYEFGGSTYDEKGRDLFVLADSEVGWRIVWRTQQTDETKRVE